MSPSPARGFLSSEFALRVGSAIAMLAVALSIAVLGGAWFAIGCAAVAVLIFTEYRRITVSAVLPAATWAAVAILAVTLALWFLVPAPAAAIFAVGAGGGLCVWEVWRKSNCWATVGLAYSALPFFALTSLRGDSEAGLHALLFVFACVWAADTLAYFAGRTIGGPKLAPAISPRKTWSGFAGGVAGSLLAGPITLWALGLAPSARAGLVAIGLSLMAQGGDLFESWIKRRFGVKDSGALIPGHGGVLDRIDGLIFASVAAWCLGALMGLLPPAGVSAGERLLSAIVLP